MEFKYHFHRFYRFYRHQNGRFQKMPHDYFIFEIMKVLHPILYSSWPSAVCHQESFTNGRIWTPPVLQAFYFIKLKVRLHTYIRPVIELKGSGHNGLFARLLLIALTCSKAQKPFQVLQTPVRPVAIRCIASQSVWISPLSVSQWFFS